MENASLPTDVWNDVTTSSSVTMIPTLTAVRDVALKVIYVIIGTVGVLDNLFVIIVFALFIKITDKVFQFLWYYCTPEFYSHNSVPVKYLNLCIWY